jgi:hypothetical protein
LIEPTCVASGCVPTRIWYGAFAVTPVIRNSKPVAFWNVRLGDVVVGRDVVDAAPAASEPYST